MNLGLKLLTKDDQSLRVEERVHYPPSGEWIDVPGNGAYLAITEGLLSGGVGPVLAVLEYDPQSRVICDAPHGVECYRRVRRVPHLEADAARSKAYAVWSKADAVWSKAYATWSKAYVTWSKADTARSKADTARSKADAAWSEVIFDWLAKARGEGA